MKKLLYIVLILLILIISAYFIHKRHISPQTKVNKNYTLLNTADVAAVKIGDVSASIPFTGDLIPITQTIISAEVDAQVKQVLVNEGQLVVKNQLLAILDDTDLKQALAMQSALWAKNKAQFVLDELKLRQQKQLYTEGFISQLAYKELETNYQASAAALAEQQAAVARAVKQLSDTMIKAPFSGFIYQKFIDNGQLANKNGKLFALANLQQMQIKAAIPSQQINAVKVKQDVYFTTQISPELYHATIARINQIADLSTRSYLVYIDFNNTHAQLKAGQFVRGYIVTQKLKQVNYINSDCIRNDDNGNKVVYVLKNNVVISRPVNVILTDTINNQSAITGIATGEQVILGNVLTVKPGDLCQIHQ